MAIKDIKKGASIVFKGYGDDVAEAEQYLTAGEAYVVSSVDVKEKKVSVEIANPGFNKKKPVSEDNAQYLDIEVFEEEFDVAEAEEEEEAPAEEVVEEEAPAPARRTAPAARAAAPAAKAAVKPAAKAPVAAKAATKTAPAAAVKGKAGVNKATPTTVKPAVKKGQTAAPAPAEEEDMVVLDSEDADIVKLVESTDDLLGLLKEKSEDAAAMDYTLGGLLYHVKLDKVHHTLDPKYAQNGGFGLYLKDNTNIEYRKAQYLIGIYIMANQHGIDPQLIAQMGWTKAAKISEVMTADNADELLKLAQENSVADLVDNIRENYVTKGKTGGTKKKVVLFKFKLFEDSAETVRNGLESAAASLGEKDLNKVFEHIVTEWATEHPLAAPAAAPVGRRVNAPQSATAKAGARPVARPAVRASAK